MVKPFLYAGISICMAGASGASAQETPHRHLPSPITETPQGSERHPRSHTDLLGVPEHVSPLKAQPELIAQDPRGPIVYRKAPDSVNGYLTSMGQLKISNLPVGVWVEIEGYWYHHQSGARNEGVFVTFPEGYFHRPVPSTVVLRFGRTPMDIRSNEGVFTQQVTLLDETPVEFDYYREFWNRREAQGAANRLVAAVPANGLMAAGASATTTAAGGTATGSACSGAVAPAEKNCLGIKISPANELKIALEKKDNDWNAPNLPECAYLLLSGEDCVLGGLSKLPVLKIEDIEVAFTSSDSTVCHKAFKGFSITMELERPITQYVLRMKSLDFLGKNEDFKVFLTETKPVEATYPVKVTCTFKNASLSFSNGLQDGLPAMKLEDAWLPKVEFTLPKAP